MNEGTENRSAVGCRPGTSAPAYMLFLDTEFTGLDQQKPDLISLALVDMEGREFYAQLPSSHYAVQCNEWVHFNVLPHLWGGEHVQSVATIRDPAPRVARRQTGPGRDRHRLP